MKIGRPREYGEADAARVIALVRGGMSYRDVGRLVGMSLAKVQRIVRVYGR